MLRRIGLLVGWFTAGLVGSIMAFLAAAVTAGSSVPVQLPALQVFTSTWDQYVFAKGTWVMDNDRQASPLQTSEITCRRALMECTGIQADLLFGMLNLHGETYQVTRWDADALSFRISNTCVDYVYTIDRASQRVIGLRTKSATPTAPCDAVNPSGAHPVLTGQEA